MSIPDSWGSCSLFDISIPKQWKTISRNKLLPEGYDVYGANGIIGKYSEFTHEYPTLMITCRGATCGNIHISNPKSYINGNAMALDGLSQCISVKFLFFYLTSFDFSKTISGSAQPQITQDGLKRLFINIPPEKEQHRIVNKIESLFSKLDKGIESLKTAQQQLKLYRQALLKHAFEGKLTEQWRKDNTEKLESAEELLARIKQERENRYQQQLGAWERAVKQWEAKGKDGKKPAKPKPKKTLNEIKKSEISNFQNIPKSWKWIRIGDISSVGTGVTPLKSRTDFYNKGTIAWVTSGALNNPFVNKESTFVTKLALKETNLRLYPIHTLLLAMYGEGKTRGKCSELLIPAATNQAIAAIVQEGLEEKTRQYLKSFLYKNYIEIRRKSSGGVQPNLNLGIVENTILPLCPLIEMEKIAEKLDQHISVIDQLEKEIAANLKKSQALRQSILKKAFSGKLVPQDPNDEPASELLKRIAIEKAELASKTKASVKKAKSRLKSKKASSNA